MPEDKYGYAPTQGEFKGVRTFAQQVKHIATANYALAAGVMAEKPPLDLKSENGPDNITSKADIMKYLKDSFAYAHKAANSLTEANVLEQVPSPFGSNKVSRLGLCDRDDFSPLRSLRPDGGISARERHRSAGQQTAVACNSTVFGKEKARAIAPFSRVRLHVLLNANG